MKSILAAHFSKRISVVLFIFYIGSQSAHSGYVQFPSIIKNIVPLQNITCCKQAITSYFHSKENFIALIFLMAQHWRTLAVGSVILASFIKGCTVWLLSLRKRVETTEKNTVGMQNTMSDVQENMNIVQKTTTVTASAVFDLQEQTMTIATDVKKVKIGVDTLNKNVSLAAKNIETIQDSQQKSERNLAFLREGWGATQDQLKIVCVQGKSHELKISSAMQLFTSSQTEHKEWCKKEWSGMEEQRSTDLKKMGNEIQQLGLNMLSMQKEQQEETTKMNKTMDSILMILQNNTRKNQSFPAKTDQLSQDKGVTIQALSYWLLWGNVLKKYVMQTSQS